MKKLIKSLVPKALLKPLQIYKKYNRAKKTNSHLKSLKIPEIPLAKNVQLLSDRKELIKNLPIEGVVAEVGVSHGDFSEQILKTNSPKVLHLIDLWEGDNSVQGKVGGEPGFELVKSRFSEQVAAEKIVLHRGYSYEELEKFQSNTFDWIFIDAAHDFENVSRDLRAAHNTIKENGFICGHDYTLWGSIGLDRFGVVEAVNKFCNEFDYHLVFLTNEPSRFVSYAIQQKK